MTYVGNIYKYYIAYRLVLDEINRKRAATGKPPIIPASDKAQQ